MSSKFAFGTALLLSVATVFAGQASSLFSVQVTLNPAGGGTSSASTTASTVAAASTATAASTSSTGNCVSSSSSGSASASVRVLCSTGVFVDISRSATRVTQLISGFNTSPDSPVPDNCRNESPRGDAGACRLGDQRLFSGAGDDSHDGWQIENQRYAVNVDANVMEASTRSRVREDRGILTALRVPTANDPSGSLEMLVSF